jgi:hypothetical protein
MNGEETVPQIKMSPQSRTRLRLMLRLAPLAGREYADPLVQDAISEVCVELAEDSERAGIPDYLTDALDELILTTVMEELDKMNTMYRRFQDGRGKRGPGDSGWSL